MEHPNPPITIIVPVYNAEKFLHKCVNNLLNQSLSDFEVLLINDGSTDCSGQICNEYAEKDSRIRAIHKQNGGPGTARNLGLKEANGEWIAFVDADDWTDKEYLKELYENIHPNAAQQGLIIQGLKFYKNENDIKPLNFSPDTYTQQNITGIFEEKQVQNCGYPMGKLYNSAIIKENNLTFDESVKIAEDLLFLLSYIPHAGYIRFIPGANYNYLFLPNSLSRKYLSFDEIYEVYKKSSECIDSIILKYNIDKDNTYIHTYRYQAGLLFQAILSLYHPQHFRPKKERLSIIKSLSEKEAALIINAYYHPLFIMRVNRLLIKKRWYNLFDTYNRALLFVRDKLKRIGIKYLNNPIKKITSPYQK